MRRFLTGCPSTWAIALLLALPLFAITPACADQQYTNGQTKDDSSAIYGSLDLYTNLTSGDQFAFPDTNLSHFSTHDIALWCYSAPMQVTGFCHIIFGSSTIQFDLWGIETGEELYGTDNVELEGEAVAPGGNTTVKATTRDQVAPTVGQDVHNVAAFI
ncbi:MAG: hypothetical protein ACO1SX_01550 [Actinomycetota bacterium]